jgi:phage terminase small subunit
MTPTQPRGQAWASGNKVTPKQRRFVGEYLKDRNGAQAAIRAGYSAKTAKEQASRLLTNVHVKQAVAEGEKAESAADAAYKCRLRRVNRSIVECDPRAFFAAPWTLKPPSEWTPEMAAAVSKFEVVKKNAVTGDGKTDTVLKLWFWNKNQAIELDYKSYGLMTPEPDDSGKDVPTFIFLEGTRIKIE